MKTTQNRVLRALTLAAIGLVAFGPLGGCAAAGLGEAKTRVKPFLDAETMDPPNSPAEATVYLDFRDQTVTFDDDHIYNSILDEMENRGWKATSYDEAQYVLIATVREFDEGSLEQAKQAAARLGTVAGGFAVAGTVAAVTDSGDIGLLALIGAGISAAYAWMTADYSYYLIMDLQIGEKIEGGFMETHSKGKGAELGLTAGAASSQGSETGKSTNKSTVTSEVIKQQSHLKHAQRIIVTTKGRRMPEEVARQAVQDKLPEAVRKQMPRIGRRS